MVCLFTTVRTHAVSTSTMDGSALLMNEETRYFVHLVLKKKTENSYIFKILTLLLLSAQYYYYQPPLSNRQLTMDWQEAFQYKCNTFIDWKT
ncbi:MAG: hypothetical protein ACI8RD_013888 [Bacillariaceae sp.]|jgi:hypothetical protein